MTAGNLYTCEYMYKEISLYAIWFMSVCLAKLADVMLICYQLGEGRCCKLVASVCKKDMNYCKIILKRQTVHLFAANHKV